MASPEVNDARIKAIEDRLDKQERTQEEILQKLNNLLSELNRYKGFIGGVLFIFSALGTAFTLFLKFKGQ